MKIVTAPDENHVEDSAEAPMLLKIPEVAKILALSRSKVYGMLESGELPSVRFGKNRRVKRADVMKLIDQNTVQAA